MGFFGSDDNAPAAEQRPDANGVTCESPGPGDAVSRVLKCSAGRSTDESIDRARK
jgi:hypothetical protein